MTLNLPRKCICICSLKGKGKGKVVPVPSLTNHHTIKAYWEWRYSSTHSLTSELDGGELTASRLGRFTPMEIAPCTHRIGGQMGPTAVLDVVVKRIIPSPRRESNPDLPARSLIALPTELSCLCLCSLLLDNSLFRKNIRIKA
jgi:hypothetical protein